MGVSGAGKTLVGEMLAERLAVAFVDGDELHGEANTRKLASGTALTDEDRWPWLDAVGRVLRQGDVVVACSALKRSYRDRLRRHRSDLVFVHLDGEHEVLQERVRKRTHAFMPPDLLASQIATLEPLADDEAGLALDVARAPEQIVGQIVEWAAGLGSV
jgi:carbohydrate kinase (thermoresistant glucokinase family)